MKSLLMGLDVGTTTIKAVVYDPSVGKVIRQASHPTPTEHPIPEWTQHDPEELWQAAAACIKEAGESLPIAALSISSLAEAGLAVDTEGNPLYPIMAWYDRRCEPQAAWWKTQLSADELYDITGQRISPSFGVNKWLWLRENVSELADRMATWLSVPDYIRLRLTGERTTDYTIASRTLLFDQSSMNWSHRMLNLAGLKEQQMPIANPSGTVTGSVTRRAAQETGLPFGMPCVLGGHDHLCGTLAAGAYAPGTVADSTGTAQALTMILTQFLERRAAAEQPYAVYAYVIPGFFVMKGGLKASGGAIQWLAAKLSGSDVPTGQLNYGALEAEAKRGIGKKAGPLWLPHFIGSGTPENDLTSRAAMIGLRGEDQRGDVFRGLLESLALWTRHNLDCMQSLSGQPFKQVILFGGTTRLDLLVQLKADALNMPVVLSDLPEASAIGAALLAGIGTKVFSSPAEAVSSLQYKTRMVEPDPNSVRWYNHLYEDIYLKLYDALKNANQSFATIERDNRS